MSDLKTATSALPGLQIAAVQLTTAEVTLYTCPAGVTFLGDIWLTNVSGTPTGSISLVKSGGTASASNRIFARPFVANEGVKLSGVKLAPGDFISGIASANTAVSVIVDGTAFSSTVVGVATGIQDDAIGTGGHSASSGTVTGTNAVAAGSNRYHLAALCVQIESGPNTANASYTTLDMSNSDGAMTKLVSVDFTVTSSITGSIHLFGRANPTSNTSHTLTGHAAFSGNVFDLQMASISLSGVASVTGATSVGPSSSAVPSLAVTSATGHRPFWAFGFSAVPQDFNRRTRYFNWSSSPFTTPHYFLFGDALGAGSVTASTAVSDFYCAVGIDLVPA